MQGYLVEDIQAFVGVINITLVNEVITNNLIPIATTMDVTQANITSLLDKSSTIMSTESVLADLMVDLNTDYTSATNSLTDLSANNHVITGYSSQWKRTAAISVPGTLAANLASLLATTYPNATDILISLIGMDLGSYADEISTMAYNVSNSISDTITTSAQEVVSGVTSQLDSVNNTMSNSTAEYIDTVNTMADQYISSLDSSFGIVFTYDNYRNIGFMLIAGLYILIIIVQVIGLSMKKPRVTKGCNLTSTLFYILLYIFGIVVLILAVAIASACTWIFIDTASGPLGALGLGSMFDTVWDFRDECYSNKSVIVAASSMGVFNASQVNLTSLTQEKLEEVDYSSVSNWNSSSSLDLSDSPANQIQGLTDVNYTRFDTTSLDNTVNTHIPDLVLSLTTLKSTIDAAQSGDSASALTFTPVTASNTEKSAGLIAYKARLSTISTTIGSMISLLNNEINGNASLLIDQINVIKSDSIYAIAIAQTYQGLYDSVIIAFNGVQTTLQSDMADYVPTFKQLLITQVSSLQVTLDAALSCYNVASDLFSVQDAFCGSGLSTLDAVWLSCIFLAVVSTLSMPLVVWGANVLYPTGYNQDEVSSPRKKGFQLRGNRRIQRSGRVEDDEY